MPRSHIHLWVDQFITSTYNDVYKAQKLFLRQQGLLGALTEENPNKIQSLAIFPNNSLVLPFQSP